MGVEFQGVIYAGCKIRPNLYEISRWLKMHSGCFAEQPCRHLLMINLVFFYSFFPPTDHGYPFTGRLLLLLQATAAREPIPAPGGRRRGRQTEGREASGIEPERNAQQWDISNMKGVPERCQSKAHPPRAWTGCHSRATPLPGQDSGACLR